MIKWTIAHRERVLTSEFPGKDFTDIITPFRCSISTQGNVLDRIERMTARLFRFTRSRSI